MGFTWVFLLPKSSAKSAKENKPSTAQHPSVVDQYLANEVSLDGMDGPFSASPFLNLHVSSFRVKKRPTREVAPHRGPFLPGRGYCQRWD